MPSDLLSELQLSRDTAMYPADRDFVFATQAGTPLTESNATRRIIKPAAKAAGVPWAAWHDLRRAAASRWAREGHGPRAMQRLLGHSDPNLSLGVYTWVRDDDLPSGDTLALRSAG